MYFVSHAAVLLLSVVVAASISSGEQCLADSAVLAKQSSSVLQRKQVTIKEEFRIDEDMAEDFPVVDSPGTAPGMTKWGEGEAAFDVPNDCTSEVKLVLNTCVKYEKALKHALKSLRKIGFAPLSDVVVFRGGSAADSLPYQDDEGITYVNLTLEAFDFTGYAGLYRFRRDPRVCARRYLYLLDTVDFAEDFPQKLRALRRLKPNEIRMTPRPNSNMAAFGHGVVDGFGSNFEYNFTKKEVVEMEFNTTSRPRKNPEDFASKVVLLKHRRFRGHADPFRTGFFRRRVFYGAFGFYKYILWGYFGDIGNGGKLMENAPGVHERIRFPRTHEVKKKPDRVM